MATGRVLLKLSGEALGPAGEGLDRARLERIAGEIARGAAAGREIAVVLGAGNFLRGAQLERAGFDRVRGDQMGMVATILNGLALECALAAQGLPAEVLSALAIEGVAGPADRRAAAAALAAGRVVIYVGGLGQPLFTTDTTAAVRAVEIGAGVLLKATKVDGVYAADPERDPAAERFERLGWEEALERRLAVMDAAAFEICRRHRMPIRVFSVLEPGRLARALMGDEVGTLVAG